MVKVKKDTRRLDEIARNVKPRAQKVIKTSAFVIAGEASILAPYDTGALSNSLAAGVVQKGELLWWCQDGVEYGIFQELGTSRMAAHPFMVPAVEHERKHFENGWSELFR